MGGLIQHDFNDGFERCVHCGVLAVGPCARCKAPVCGDCCVLTSGGTRTWAICLGCDRRAGRGLGRAWLRVVGWILMPFVVVIGLLLALYAVFGNGN